MPGAQCPEWNEVVVAVARAVVRACDARSSKGGIFRLIKIVELLLAQLFKGSAVVTEQNDVLILASQALTTARDMATITSFHSGR